VWLTPGILSTGKKRHEDHGWKLALANLKNKLKNKKKKRPGAWLKWRP
jgi:hypothetical protein